MTTLEVGQAIADKLIAAEIDATCDPRSATPPCVLVTPPQMTFDHLCGGTGLWSLFALSPTTANIDAWKVLDDLLSKVDSVFPIERADFVAYSLSPGNPPIPAFRIQITESFEV